MISKLNHAYSGFFIWFLHCCVLLFVNVLFTLMDIYTLLRLSVELVTINVVVVLCAIGVDGLDDGCDSGCLVVLEDHVKDTGTISRSQEVGTERTEKSLWLVFGHFMPLSVTLQQVGRLLGIVEC